MRRSADGLWDHPPTGILPAFPRSRPTESMERSHGIPLPGRNRSTVGRVVNNGSSLRVLQLLPVLADSRRAQIETPESNLFAVAIAECLFSGKLTVLPSLSTVLPEFYLGVLASLLLPSTCSLHDHAYITPSWRSHASTDTIDRRYSSAFRILQRKYVRSVDLAPAPFLLVWPQPADQQSVAGCVRDLARSASTMRF